MGENVRVSVNLNALEETLELLASATHENRRLQAELAAVAERCAPLVSCLKATADRLLVLGMSTHEIDAALAAYDAAQGAGRGT